MEYNIENILTKVFDVLDVEIESGYVIMNKYEEIPISLPSDIDICISQHEFKRLDLIITKLSKKTGLVIIQKIWHNYRKCAYILSPLKIDFPFRLQLDFFSDFAVKNTPLLIPYEEMLSNTRLFGRFKVPSYELEYVFLTMRRVFKDDFNLKNCEIIRHALLSDNFELTLKYSEKYWGGVLASKLSKHIFDCNVTALNELRDELWNKLKVHSMQNSFGKYKIKYLFYELIRKAYRIKYPVGLSIAFLSPDGGGKSSIVKELEFLCSGSFHGFKRFYFRPRLLKNIGSYNLLDPKSESDSNPNPHDVTFDSRFKSFIRFLFYNIDFLIGYFVLVRPLIIKKYLVVFDRYYYDYLVDMKRYKYKLPLWIPKIFRFFIPKPEIVFVLNGTAEIFYSRKQELSIDEIKRQIIKYKGLNEFITDIHIIDADKNLKFVLVDIVSSILEKKATQTAMKMKNKLDDNYIPI